MFKLCSRCKATKELSEFYRKGDGFRSECKACAKKKAPDREKWKERASIWREANPEKAKAIAAKYHSSHPEKLRNRAAKWRKMNPEKINDKNKVRAYRVRGASGKHTLKQWEELKVKCGNKCKHCGKGEPAISLTRDHIVPISKGGTNDISNIQPLCKSCNSRKSNKVIG